MKGAWRRLRHAVEAILVLGFGYVADILPVWSLPLLVECLSGLAFSVVRIRRRIVMENLRRAFTGEKDDQEIQRIARGVYRNFAKTLVEMCRLGHLHELDRLTIVEGFDVVVTALREGRGVILLSGHLGSWEVGAAIVARRLGHLKVVAAPMTNTMVDMFLNRHRRSASVEPIPPGVTIRGVVKALRQGETVAFLADQDAGRQGVFVEFFRCPASTAPGPAAIAVRWGVPIILCFNIREAEGGYRLIFERIPIPDGTQEAAVESIMREYSRRLEACIRAYPEQWLWLHRRWKTKREDNYSPQRSQREENGRENPGQVGQSPYS